MISIPNRVSLAEACLGGVAANPENVIVWATPSVAPRLIQMVPWEVTTDPPIVSNTAKWLVAVGGGKLIDRAKVLRRQHPGLKLAILPTLWGSGAEASPISVLDVGSRKEIQRSSDLLPDLIIHAPEFADSAPETLKKFACGDVWSHALEGFLSPLANDELRDDLAQVIHQIVALQMSNSAGWLRASAFACAAQAKSSVGLVHGIAHTLEPVMQMGHACLCSTYLLPVMLFNQERSPKWRLLGDYQFDVPAIVEIISRFHCHKTFLEGLPVIRDRWTQILRDPCSRTNSALVRPSDIEFFLNFRV